MPTSVSVNPPQISQGTTNIDQLPSINQNQSNSNVPQQNFNSFYQGAGANSSPEPMAANECLGGGMFGSSF